jgi:hypothetical protein
MNLAIGAISIADLPNSETPARCGRATAWKIRRVI